MRKATKSPHSQESPSWSVGQVGGDQAIRFGGGVVFDNRMNNVLGRRHSVTTNQGNDVFSDVEVCRENSLAIFKMEMESNLGKLLALLVR